MNSTQFSRYRGWTLAAAVAAMFMTPATLGQSGHQVMVMDNGSGPQLMHFTMPDFVQLRTPDYRRADLPVMADKLVLTDDQKVIVEILLDAYLGEFKTLAKAMLPAPSSQTIHFGSGHGADGDAAGNDFVLGDIAGGLLHPGGLDIDMDGGGNIAVRIQGGQGMGAPETDEEGGTFVIAVAEGDDGGMPVGVEPGVFVAVETADGEEIPEEVMRELEARATEMAERMRERMENGELEMHDMGGEAMADRMAMHQMRMEEMAAKAEEFKTKKRTLRQRFEGDVRIQLEPDQLDRWPSLDRTLTRYKSLPLARLDGERTDLISILEAAELSDADREKLAPATHDYEVALHEALVRRNETVASAQREVDQAMGAGDHDRALSFVDRATRSRVAVRNVNTQFADSITAILPDEPAKAFRNEVNLKSFPRVYRTTRGEKAFDAVLARKDLDVKIREVVLDFQRAYLDELAIANENLRRDIMRFQPEESRKAIESLETAMAGGEFTMHSQDDAVHTAFQKRRDLDERYLKYVRDMMPEEQVALIPELKPKEERQTMFRFLTEEPQ